MHIMKCVGLALALATAPLAGCTAITDAIGSFTQPSPTQATTLAQALQLAKIATDTADLAVNTAHLSTSVLQGLRKSNDAVHAALQALEDANAKGQSLTFGAFNGTYAAFIAYTADNNIALAK